MGGWGDGVSLYVHSPYLPLKPTSLTEQYCHLAQENQSSESICPAQLGAAIDVVINRPQFRRARWGILIEPLSPNATNRVFYSHEAQRYFIPASYVKLLTT
jgi:D-alanyl-D-alanine carboxypeptidase/D-alanyl-D-alanine-endopeptidase (penicillin-binding protein 4)